jgi:hypothetical protein
MLWIPFRRAFRNVIFRGGVEELVNNTARWSHGINYLIILSIVLFITWPKEAFLNLRDPPLPYVATGGIALVMLAYINISQGSRKLLGEQYMSLREWLSLAPIKADTFVRGYVAAGFLECGFFWALSLPLLVLAAGVAGESLTHAAVGSLIVLICAGTYRIIAVALLLCLERDEFLLYLLVRVFYGFMIVVSGFVWPVCNPIWAFANASLWHKDYRLQEQALPGIEIPGWGVTVGLHLLIAGLFFIIASVRVRWIRRQAMRLDVASEEVETR